MNSFIMVVDKRYTNVWKRGFKNYYLTYNFVV